VLLKNNNGILPLPKTASKIFVAGKSANDIGNQSGGWTVSWQGGSGATTPGTTILQAIRNTVSPGTTVTFSANGSGIDGSYKAAIAVVGETPYAEGRGDRPGGMGLDSTDLATLSTLRAAGVPLVVVLVSGRPLDIAAQLPNWDALVEAWPASVLTRLASGSSASGTIQYRLDSPTGPLIASVPVSSTGGWQSWTSRTVALSGPATGVHRLYLVFSSPGTADFVNVNWFQFAH
jgi:hypothetical protein